MAPIWIVPLGGLGRFYEAQVPKGVEVGIVLSGLMVTALKAVEENA